MFKSAAAKLAHNSTIPALAGNQDLRPLQDLITAEKAVIVSLQKLSADFSKASEALKTWGLGEGDDLGSILTASATILTHFNSALSQYASHGHTIRERLKEIRTREENLEELKRRRRSMMSKADSAEKKLSKMNPEHKNVAQQTDLLNRLREDIRGLDTEIMRDEAAIGDFKRSATRTWMGLKFGGLLECCEKGVIAGEYGKLIISEIPEEVTQPGMPRNPYFGHSKVEELIAEAHRCVNEVRLSTIPSSSPQARRPDQQLPQVPHVSESPFMNQGSFSPPNLQPPVESSGEDSRRDFLPEPSNQGFGTGRFLDSPTEPTSSAFAQSQHQPQYSGSLSSASAFQSQQYGRRVDEFGLPSPSGPIDVSNTGGGRFATFPVKGRSGSTGATGSGPIGAGGQQTQQRSDEKEPTFSLLSAPQHAPSDSFSSSVAQALAATERDRTSQDEAPPPVRPGRLSKDGPAPSYEASIDSDVNPRASEKKLRSMDDQLSPPPHGRKVSNISDDGAILAHVSSEPTASTHYRNGGGGGDEVNDKHVSRHVRFGDVSQINDAPPPPLTPQDHSQFVPSSFEPTGQGQGQGQGQGPERKTSFGDRGDAKESSVPSAATTAMNAEEERALNAAAAREIASELHSSPGTHPTSGSGDAQSSLALLAPPIAPYMSADRKSTSPRPEYTTAPTSPATSSPDPAPSYTEQPPTLSSLAQQYSNSSAGSEPIAAAAPPTQYAHGQVSFYPQGQGHVPSALSSVTPAYTPPQPAQQPHLPSPYEQEFDPYEEHNRQERGQGYSGGGQARGSPAPPRINIPPVSQRQYQQESPSGSYSYYGGERGATDAKPGGGLSPTTYGSSSPFDQPAPPNAPYARSGVGNRSTSSLNASIGSSGSGGKISAAAFKRPQPRLGTGASSPFAPPSPTLLSSGPGVGGDGGKRVPSSYEADFAQGRQQQQQQPVQPLEIRKQRQEDFDPEQYDYISAYVNNGGDGHEQQRYDDGTGGARGGYYAEQAQRAVSAGGAGWAGIGSGGGGGPTQGGAGGNGGGYGQGRFATNLENESLR